MPKKKVDRVFSIFDNDFAQNEPIFTYTKEGKVVKSFWHDLTDKMIFWLIRERHSVVTNLAGERVCRPVEYNLSGFHGDKEREDGFEAVCGALNFFLMNHIRRHLTPDLYPNTMIFLGGANEIGYCLQHTFKNPDGRGLEQGGITMVKVIDGKGRLIDLELSNPHPRSSFDPSKMIVILVEDFVGTGRSIELAKRKLESMGAKVVSVVSVFNCLGSHWPFDIPIKITFQNILFAKYLEGNCPVCMASSE